MAEINYDDERFAKVETDKNTALAEVDSTYQGMIDKSQGFYNEQIQAAKDYGETQTQLQQEQTDFAIDQINQQKEQAEKDYHKEQSAAYVDWQKQSNDYGSNAEKMADAGLAHSGYSESSKVAMYNAYQNRLATARETFSKAVLNYDNAIKDAQLKNSAVLADIAFQTLQTTLNLGMQGFQYENQLILDRLNQKTQLDQVYYNRYQDVINQMNTENSMAEQVRQFNASLAEDQRQFNMSYNKSGGGSGGSNGKNSPSITGSVNKGSGSIWDKVINFLENANAKNVDAKNAAKSYGNAKRYLVNNGKADCVDGKGGCSRLLSEEQWKKGKTMSVTLGIQDVMYDHNTYKDYLEDYIDYAMSIGE
jgi:hypothetical protein